MSKTVQFPKIKKEQVYKLNTCAGCQKDITENESSAKITLPFMKRIEYIALCTDCAEVSRQHGVYV